MVIVIQAILVKVVISKLKQSLNLKKNAKENGNGLKINMKESNKMLKKK